MTNSIQKILLSVQNQLYLYADVAANDAKTGSSVFWFFLNNQNECGTKIINMTKLTITKTGEVTVAFIFHVLISYSE